MSPSAPTNNQDRDNDLQAIEMRLLLEALYLRYQHDFRAYAPASLSRRVRHGMQQLGFDTFAALQHAVLREPALLTGLLHHLTVQVSEMFRDPVHFLMLRNAIAATTLPAIG